MAIEGNRIGPFIGGLNTASDPTSIGDTDLAELVNMELDLDGSIVSRPPIVSDGNPIPDVTNHRGLTIVGFYTTSSGANYLIGHNGVNTYYYNGTTWTQICAFPVTAITQYRDVLWLLSPVGHAEGSGKWDGATFTTVSGMPHGTSIVSHKERLWVVNGPDATTNGSRVHYSEVGDPDNWPGNFVNINAGDGQNCVALYIYFNDILIFKTRSTYRFSYSSSPDTGVVSILSNNVGAASATAVASYENMLYVIYSDKVYEVSNFNFNQINNKVPLLSVNPDYTLPTLVAASVWLDRLFIQYYGTLFVHSIDTGTWAIWDTSEAGFNVGRVLSIPVSGTNERPDAYVSPNATTNRDIYRISERLDATRSEDMDCVIKTKNYDFQSSHTFKRMTYWGFDAIVKTNVDATVFPIVHSVLPTWAQVSAFTWGALSSNSWGRPLDLSIDVTDSIEAGGALGERKFIKCLKSLRFRQVAFKLEFHTDGTPSTSPVKVFSLTTFVGVKERVSKKVS